MFEGTKRKTQSWIGITFSDGVFLVARTNFLEEGAFETGEVAMSVVRLAVGVLVAGMLFGVVLVAFSLGEVTVRRTTIVRSGSPFYEGVYYGECARENNKTYCATDRTTDKNGYPLK